MKRFLLLFLFLLLPPLSLAQIKIVNTGASTITNQPVKIPMYFRQGDIPSCVNVLFAQEGNTMTAVATTQTDVKNRWPDGSLKFAIVSFVVPSLAAGATGIVQRIPQVACNNGGQLTAAQMLAAGYNFDAQIQLTGAVNHNISARAILSAASGCNPPGSDIDGFIATTGNLCTYWMSGPIVTTVILEDRAARTFDVNTDGLTGNPLHPIFECSFFPLTNQVECGYMLEDIWASTTANNSARDQTYSLVLTAGNTAPITVATQPSQKVITRSKWHQRWCVNGTGKGTQNGCEVGTLNIDLNWPYLAQTKFVPNWDPNVLVLTPTYISNFVTAFNNAATNKSLVGTNAGVGFFPGPNGCGGSSAGTTFDQCSAGGFNQTGAAHFHGPLTTSDLSCLISQDPTLCNTVTLGNADLAGAIPYWYREADTSPGHGLFFDAPLNSVAPYGRIISINDRTQLNMQDATIQAACNTNYPADYPNYGGVGGQDLGVFAGETNAAHWGNTAYAAYLISGQYAYYEQQVMQGAFATGMAGDYSPGSRACTQPTNNAALRMGAAGYWPNDQERSNDWVAREVALGAFIALDGSPEKAYLEDKLRANLAVWEGVHGIPCDIPGTGVYQPYCGGSGIGTAWSYGNTARIANDNSAGTTLGSWAIGPARGSNGYAGNSPLCNGNTTAPCPAVQFPGAPGGGNSNFQNAYSGVMIGWINDLGYCPQTNGGCAMQGYIANHYLNEALNPASNPFHLSDYVYPTLDATFHQITTWAQDQTFYATQSSAWPTCPGGGAADEWYIAENVAAMSYLTGITSSQGGYLGSAAYAAIRSGAIEPCKINFTNQSPKWDIVPRSLIPVATAAAPTAPAVSISPNPISFGSVPIAVTSSPFTATVTNTGTAALVLNVPYFTITGPNATDFAKIGGTCADGGTVNTSTSCTAILTFTPSITGSESASFNVAGNANGSTSLVGTGLSSAIATFNAASINFLNEFQSVTSAGFALTLTNTGGGSITVGGVSFTGVNRTDFAQTNTCGSPLTGGQSCTFSVTFTPVTLGIIETATMTITSTANTSPHVFPLQGMGVRQISGVGQITGTGTIQVQP